MIKNDLKTAYMKNKIDNIIQEDKDNKVKRINIRYEELESIELEGIDTRDAPDFVDAYIISASYSDRELNDAELDELNDDGDFVHEQVYKHLF